MKAEIFSELTALAAAHRPFWLVTVIATGDSAPAAAGMRMIVCDEGISGTVGGGEVEQRICEKIRRLRPSAVERWSFDLGRSGRGEATGMACGGSQEVLVEPFGPSSSLVIVGGGHCGIALAAAAARLDFAVTIIDDRPQWASREKHPDAATVICADYGRVLEHIAPSDSHYAVIMTHGHRHDETVLRQLLSRSWRYLGMIGSRQKVREMLARLQADGMATEKLRRVFAPVGFAIGSHAPAEIAVSILAQLLAVRNGVTAIRFNDNPLLEP